MQVFFLRVQIMGGIFGVVSEGNCAKALFYGTDYHSHLGTENAGLAVYGSGGFSHAIHSISQAQFKSRFVDDYKGMEGRMGLGAINDESPQPLIIRSKFGTYALAAIGLITNKDELTRNLLREGGSFSEMADGGVNNVELVAKLINRGENIVDGIVRMQQAVEGSVCLLLMTREGIYAARDRYGRFPLEIGKEVSPAGSAPGYTAATESSSFANLGYELSRSLGPGEIVRLIATGFMSNVRPVKRNMSAPSSGSTREILHRAMKGSASKTPGSGAAGPWPGTIRLKRILLRESPIPASATPSVMPWNPAFRTDAPWSNTRRDTGEATRLPPRTSGTWSQR
jgi:glutamine phosphoribosylpyrophosphate amidotransferase